MNKKIKKIIFSCSLLGLGVLSYNLIQDVSPKEHNESSTVNAGRITYDLVKADKSNWGTEADKSASWSNANKSKLMYELYDGDVKFSGKQGDKKFNLGGFSAIGGYATHYYLNQTSYVVYTNKDKPSEKFVATTNRNYGTSKPARQRGYVSSTYNIYISGYKNRHKCVQKYNWKKGVNSQSAMLVDTKLNLAPQDCNRIYNGTGFKSSIYLKTLFNDNKAKTYRLDFVTQVRANNKPSTQKTTYTDLYNTTVTETAFKGNFKNKTTGKVNLVKGVVTVKSDLNNLTYRVVSQKVIRLRNPNNTKGVTTISKNFDWNYHYLLQPCYYAWACSGEPRYFSFQENINPYDTTVKSSHNSSIYDAKLSSNGKRAISKNKLKGYGYSARFYVMKNDYSGKPDIMTTTTYLNFDGKQMKISFKPDPIERKFKYTTHLVDTDGKVLKAYSIKSKNFVANTKNTIYSEKPPKTLTIGTTVYKRVAKSDNKKNTSFTKWTDKYVVTPYVFKFVYNKEDSTSGDSDGEVNGKIKFSFNKQTTTADTNVNFYSNTYITTTGDSHTYKLGAKRLLSYLGTDTSSFKLMKTYMSDGSTNSGGIGKKYFTGNDVSIFTYNGTPRKLYDVMKSVGVAETSSGNLSLYYSSYIFFFQDEIKKLDKEEKIPYGCPTAKDPDKTCYNIVKTYKAKTLAEVYSESGFSPSSNNVDKTNLQVEDEEQESMVTANRIGKRFSLGLYIKHYNTHRALSEDSDTVKAFVSKESEINSGSGVITSYYEYFTLPSLEDREFVTQSGMPVLDGTIEYQNENKPFTNKSGALKSSGGTTYEYLYGTTNTIRSNYNPAKEKTYTKYLSNDTHNVDNFYQVPDVDKNLKCIKNGTKSCDMSSDTNKSRLEAVANPDNAQLEGYKIPIDSEPDLISNSSVFGATDKSAKAEMNIITKDSFVVSKYTGFISKIPEKDNSGTEIKPSATSDIKNRTSSQYKDFTKADYNDEPIIKANPSKPALFDVSHKMYYMPIEADYIVRQKSYGDDEADEDDLSQEEGNTEDLENEGIEDMDENADGVDESLDNKENDSKESDVESKPYPIDVEATKSLYAKSKQDILLPNEIYTNYGELGVIGINELSIDFSQNFSFQKFLIGSVQDDTWVAEQSEQPIKITGASNINAEIKGSTGYTVIDIPKATARTIFEKEMLKPKTSNKKGVVVSQRSGKLFGLRSTDGVSFYNKLKNTYNIIK